MDNVVFTKGFVFNEEIADIYESPTFHIHISRQTERYSGRCYIVLTKIRDGDSVHKFTIPIGLAHSIAFYLEQSSKKYGDRTPRPIHIDDFT